MLYDDNVRETICLALEFASWTDKSPSKGSPKADVSVFTNNPGRSASVSSKSNNAAAARETRSAAQNGQKQGGAGETGFGGVSGGASLSRLPASPSHPAAFVPSTILHPRSPSLPVSSSPLLPVFRSPCLGFCSFVVFVVGSDGRLLGGSSSRNHSGIRSVGSQQQGLSQQLRGFFSKEDARIVGVPCNSSCGERRQRKQGPGRPGWPGDGVRHHPREGPLEEARGRRGTGASCTCSRRRDVAS